MAKVVDYGRVYLADESTYFLSDDLSIQSGNGDLLLLWVATDNGRTVTTPTGWTQEVSDTTQGIGGVLLSRVTTAVNEALPNITISAVDEVCFLAISITGQSSSSPITDITANRQGADQNHQWVAHTTTNAKSLVIYLVGMDADGPASPFEVHQFFDTIDLGNVTANGGWRWQESTGTIPAMRGRATASDGYHCISLSVKDATISVPPDFYFQTWPRDGTATSDPTTTFNFNNDVYNSGVLVDGTARTDITFNASTGPISVGSTSPDSGTATITGGNEDEARVLTDTGKSWTTDQWKGYSVTWGGETSYIVSNTATALTTVNSQRMITGIGISYTINDQAGVTCSSTTSYVNGRVYRLDDGGNTAPTGMTDLNYYWVTYIDSTTIGLTNMVDNTMYKESGLNGYFNITATGTGTMTLREVSLIPQEITQNSILANEQGNGWMGEAETYTTGINMTNKILAYTMRVTNPRKMYMLLVDGDGDWKSYQINGEKAVNTTVTGLIDTNNSTKQTYEYGTFDNTNVKKIVQLLQKNSWKDSATADLPRFCLYSKYQIVGGQSGSKIDWNKLNDIFSLYFPGTTGSGSSGQFAYYNTLEIGGDGTLLTYFNDSNKSIAFPPESNGTDQFTKYTPSTSITLDGTASSEIILSNHQFYGESAYTYTVSSGDASGAEVGGTFIESTFTANSADTYDGDIWIGGGGITPNGANFINCVFDAVNRTNGAFILGDMGTLTNITVRNATDGIEIDTAGTYDLSEFTFTNNTNDIDITASTGTVTLQLGIGQSAPTYTTAGATVVIEPGQVTVKVTCKDAGDLTVISGARVLLTADTGGDLPFQDSVSITRSGSTATVSHTAHGLSDGDKVLIAGANETEYNGIKTITNTSTNAYDYTVSGTPASPATGTITSTAVILDGDSNGSGVVQNTSFTYTSNQPVTGKTRKGTATPFYRSSNIAGTITTTGFDLTAFLIGDE